MNEPVKNLNLILPAIVSENSSEVLCRLKQICHGEYFLEAAFPNGYNTEKDCIILKKVNIEINSTNLQGELKLLLRKYVKNSDEVNRRHINAFLMNHDSYDWLEGLVNVLRGWMDDKSIIALGKLTSLLVFESQTTGSVLLGLKMMSSYYPDREMKKRVLTLGGISCFTWQLFASLAVNDREHDRELIEELMHINKGWGRVHLLSRYLEYFPDAIEHGLLNMHFYDGTSPDVIAWHLATKCNLPEYLQSSLSGEALDDVSLLIFHLAKARPEYRIDTLENGPEIIEQYLKLVADSDAISKIISSTLNEIFLLFENLISAQSHKLWQREYCINSMLDVKLLSERF